MELPGHLERADGAVFPAHRLIVQLCGWLRAKQLAVTAITFSLERDFCGTVTRKAVAGHQAPLVHASLPSVSGPERVRNPSAGVTGSVMCESQ